MQTNEKRQIAGKWTQLIPTTRMGLEEHKKNWFMYKNNSGVQTILTTFRS